MNNDEIFLLIDKIDSNITDIKKKIYRNFWLQVVIFSLAISHKYIPKFDSYLERYIELNFKIIEITIPFVLFFLVINFGYLNFLYINQRKIEIELIKNLKVDLKIISKTKIDSIYRK